MREHSEIAWNIASRYSSVLASETRDLAAQIDVAIAEAARPYVDALQAIRDLEPGTQQWIDGEIPDSHGTQLAGQMLILARKALDNCEECRMREVQRTGRTKAGNDISGI